MSLDKPRHQPPSEESLPTERDRSEPDAGLDPPLADPPQATPTPPPDKPRRKRRPRFVLRERMACAAPASIWRAFVAVPVRRRRVAPSA